MAWHLFGPNPSDRAMMEEVLELLASDSPSQDWSASTTASNTTDTNHNSSVTGLNHSSTGDTNHDEDEDNGGSAEDTGGNVEMSSSNDDSIEEKYPAGHSVQEQVQGSLGLVQQTQDLMYATALALLFYPSRRNVGRLEFFGGDLGLIASAAAASSPNAPPPAAASPAKPGQVAVAAPIPIAPQQSIGRRSTSPPRTSASDTTSKVLRTGQRVHIMNSAEFDEFRRKLRMQKASRRYRKHGGQKEFECSLVHIRAVRLNSHHRRTQISSLKPPVLTLNRRGVARFGRTPSNLFRTVTYCSNANVGDRWAAIDALWSSWGSNSFGLASGTVGCRLFGFRARTENATVCLPAGLSVKYEVTFELPGSDEDSEPEVATPAIVHDALQLKGDDGSSLEVPLMARRACPLLEVTPPLCELGLVVLTQRSARCVEVQNCGARSGRFVVEVLAANDNSTKAAIAVSPQRGKLAPLESVNVKVEANGLETGDFRGIVRVRIWETDEYEDDQHATTSAAPAAEKIVDVSGSVVEHTAELVLRQGLEPVHSLFFGSLFAGETRTIETLLRNNGPQPLTFKTSISFGGSAGAIEEDREAYERRKELQISPADGCIDPFSEALVTFIYHPRAKTPEEIHRIERNQGAAGDQDGEYTGSAHSLDSSSPFTLLPAPAQPLTAFASIICEDLQAQNLTFEVSAKTYVPRLQLSPPPPLDFGDVRSYDRADILLSLKNLSGLPVRFEAPKDVPHYSVNPRTGRLDVLQSQSLVVSFAPTQLGTFNSILALQINGGVLEIPLKVLGRAAVVGPVPPVNERLVGGPLALPADFAPKFKFLLPEEAKQAKGKLSRRFQRQPPYELAALNGTAALDEFEFQGTNNTHLTYCVKELARRADHRAAYQDYLAQSRAQREAKAKGGKGKAQNLKKRVAQARGGNQEEDKEDVDLGMARPQPQELRLPLSLAKTNDPLWLNQHPTGGNSGQSKAFFDEFKGVKRKFKSAPATPAELADCARTLEFDELEQVVSGPKTLNFGRLSVNGSATRSLTVQNNLQQNVLVALPLGKDGASGSPEELARKTPLTSQVVPPHSKAGFDLVFSSSREQFFQQTITYSINGVHPRQVTIVAEVAPIVVELAPEDLRFDFGALDLSSSTAREVVITNTCDSEAPFLWTRMPMVATPDGSTRPESSKSNATTTVTTTTMADRSSNANTTTVFEVIPASGTLVPSATLVCKVVYTPPAMTRPMMAALGITQKTGAVWLAQMFQLDVTGGEKGFLNCRALLPEVKVVSREKKVDFGTISVGVEREKKLTLANLGMHTRAVFYASIEPQSMSTTVGLQVSPAQGVVDPQESTEVSVKLFPHRAITLDGTSGSQVNIIVTIRGGKVLRLPVNASVLVPDVFLAPADAIDYGETIRWQIDTTRLRQGNLIQFAAGAAAAVAASGVSSGAALAKRIASANPTNSATSVVFHVAPDRGELAPGEEVTVRVSFLPLDAVEYAEDELPLLVDGEFYVNFSLRGEGIYPHLSFSTNRVVLPTVPLGVTASAKFQVYATGYDHLELNCRVPLDTSRAPLTVLFPRGKTLSMACPSLPVELRFSSTSSVAFNARVEFFDADGNSFTLPVAGCAENCLFTNYTFLQAHGLAAELSEDFSGSPRSTRKESSKSDLESDGILKSSPDFQFYTHASGHFPVYLLSSNQAQVEIEKPKESQQNATANGFVVVDPSTGLDEEESTSSWPFLLNQQQTIPSLGGGSSTNKRKNAEVSNSTTGSSKAHGSTVNSNSVAQPSKKDQLAQLTAQFMELLRFLRSYGAMVHDVFPEQLLAQEFYLRACENPQVDPALLSSPSHASLPFVARRRRRNFWILVETYETDVGSSTSWQLISRPLSGPKRVSLFPMDARGHKLPTKTSICRSITAPSGVTADTRRLWTGLWMDTDRFLRRYTGREILLLLLHLQQTLPQFIPKATIEFRGGLGQAMEKSIELKNPSAKPLCYHVFLDKGDRNSVGFGAATGTDATASEFTIESNDIVLDPGRPWRLLSLFAKILEENHSSFGVSSCSRRSHWIFVDWRRGSYYGFPLRVQHCFEKTCSCHSTGDQDVREARGRDFDREPVPYQCEFQAVHDTAIDSNRAESTTGIPNSGSSTMGVLPTSRGGTRRRSVQPGNQGRNSVSSFGMGTDASGFGRKKSIISGKNRGEDGDFSWCIAAQQPFYLPDFGTSGSSNNDDGIDGGGLSVPSSGLSGASISIRKNGSAKVKLEFLPLVPGNYRCQLLFLDEKLTLTAGSGKPVPVSGRSDTSGIDSSGPKVPLKANQARLCTPRSVLAGTNSVLIDFQPKGAGRYACKLLLRSRNSICGSSDVRVYDLIAKVREPNVKTQLEFVAPARHSIVQEIPLSNPTDTTWSLKAVFSNGNTDSSASKPPASMFSGPPALVVPAKRSATYPLTFTPSWMYHETRTFVLLNTATQQQFEFELSGYGEEPLAQDHVVFSCQARTMFKVESDLRDVVGASTITVPAGSGSNRSVKYSLTFSPLVSGSYFGSVTFTNEATNEYLWYTVEAL
ncbi:hypothetical protein GQ600_12334 [Phytophthora cactorum]|nr:hypothetical protein GQ600_12334 [Phytophthora cactorum]